MSLVIDASITIAWMFDDENDEKAKEVARLVVSDGAIVPQLWRLEVANVLRTSERRGRCETDFVDRSLARLERLPIAVDDETGRRAWNATLELARNENLTVYDAAYLELALRLELPLATRDGDLIEAAERRQVSVLGQER